MTEWRWMLACLLVGVACAVLQPEQPRSVIAAMLLVTALGALRDEYRR